MLDLVQPQSDTNQREVAAALAMFHTEVAESLKHASGRLAAGGEYVKWLRGDVEPIDQQDDE